ncbi:unnamed protein product [Prorocentrum cordatum]|uniref:Uncharacterized protein n=1 Tax=Prorocentrum cordatum TaxID=2364126 RepID=A0ABN9T3G0_9DINO|nr:unnamed protein product [Polarella glacialis]
MPAAAAAAAAAQAVAARGEQNGTKTLLLRSGGMLGSASGGTTKLATSLSGTVPAPSSGVTWSQLQNFLFPANLEHPESTGRLELFAQHGPVDQSSRLRGGRGGKHVHTDAEIRLMIKNETREALFAVIGKPRDTAEVVVDQLLPVALVHNYTLSEIKHILKDVPVGSSGQMDFADLQDAILANQQRRLKALVKHRGGVVKERGPVVPYQSAAAEEGVPPGGAVGEAEEASVRLHADRWAGGAEPDQLAHGQCPADPRAWLRQRQVGPLLCLEAHRQELLRGGEECVAAQ